MTRALCRIRSWLGCSKRTSLGARACAADRTSLTVTLAAACASGSTSMNASMSSRATLGSSVQTHFFQNATPRTPVTMQSAVRRNAPQRRLVSTCIRWAHRARNKGCARHCTNYSASCGLGHTRPAGCCTSRIGTRSNCGARRAISAHTAPQKSNKWSVGREAESTARYSLPVHCLQAPCAMAKAIMLSVWFARKKPTLQLM
jgi:hypothetical protein